MNNIDMRGIYGITATPFHEDESVDMNSLERVVRFTVESGCHGVVMPVMASEYHVLTDTERKAVIDLTVKTVAGAVPVVAGVTGVSTQHSVELAKFAEGAGADSIIAMPPHNPPTKPDEVLKFFEKLSEAVSLPIWIQNHNAGGGLSAEQLAKICRSFENVSHVKEETTFAGHVTTRFLKLAGDSCQGVMGGSSCKNIINEYRRGMTGNMPASHFGDPMSKMWNLLDSGDEKSAKQIHGRLLPLINFEATYGIAAFKAVLVRRGLISSPTMRAPGRVSLDQLDNDDLDRMLRDISDLLTQKAN